MRPRSWVPLCADDPVPGDPEQLRLSAARSRAAAAALEQQAADLERLAAAPGEAAALDRLREEAGAVAHELRRAATRCRVVGSALSAAAPALEDAQRASLRVLQEAQAAAGAAPPADLADVLTRARTALAGVVRDWDEAQERAARAVRSACSGDGLADGHWRWVHRAWDAAAGVVRAHAAGLARLAGALSVVSTVLAAAAFLLPVLGPALAALAGALAGVAALVHLALAVAGPGDWSDVVWDGVGMATGVVGGRAGAVALRRITAAADRLAGEPAAAAVRTVRAPSVGAAHRVLADPAAAPADRAGAAWRLREAADAERRARERATADLLGEPGLRHRLAYGPGEAAAAARARARVAAAHPSSRRGRRAVRDAGDALVVVGAARWVGFALDPVDRADRRLTGHSHEDGFGLRHSRRRSVRSPR
ncbi:hypothetical protein EV189_0694 [Motilibacter rhizosphaerae]|uniref:Uncharacterized protein n=2 Tax=Motilibacter rhizosphaerae TaxID=598652 RepID=A0A4Q7NVZ3_9ACTN|nr:hypothetical protein EV189_0694 [Motilibacter rhizosphaerae]